MTKEKTLLGWKNPVWPLKCAGLESVTLEAAKRDNILTKQSCQNKTCFEIIIKRFFLLPNVTPHNAKHIVGFSLGRNRVPFGYFVVVLIIKDINNFHSLLDYIFKLTTLFTPIHL